MRADEPQVELRPRSALEAADLGFAMVRAWWRPLVATWLALVVPVASITAIALRDYPWFGLLAIWWLRPLFARVPLHVLSRKVFDQPAGVAETLRSLPQLARSQLLLSLTLLRFSPTRTLLQPVVQLERLRGKARRERSALLASRDIGAAMGVMGVGAHINGAVILGAFATVQLLVPEDVSWEFGSLFTPFFEDVRMGWSGLLLPGMYLVGISVVEPLLVAAGFAMYLNRRVFLEGWDIEIALRRLSDRARPAASPLRATAAGLLAVLAFSFAAAGTARAEVADLSACAPGDPRSANACADALMATGDFGGTREVEWWVLKEIQSEEEAEIGDGDGFLDWLGPILATLIEILAWAALALAVIALAVAFARSFDGTRRARAVEVASPTRLFGLDLEPDSLPEDLVGAARAAWRRGDFIEAMSLLYRGALIHLIEAQKLNIPESATEYECVAVVRTSQQSETTHAFTQLTHAWVGTRYATTPPSADAFETLCAGFDRVFGPSEPLPETSPDSPHDEDPDAPNGEQSPRADSEGPA